VGSVLRVPHPLLCEQFQVDHVATSLSGPCVLHSMRIEPKRSTLVE
jgi:hypothetical protein